MRRNCDNNDYDDEEDLDDDPVLAHALVPEVDPGYVSRRVQQILSCSFKTVANVSDDLILKLKKRALNSLLSRKGTKKAKSFYALNFLKYKPELFEFLCSQVKKQCYVGTI
jgi:hypothetical protein